MLIGYDKVLKKEARTKESIHEVFVNDFDDSYHSDITSDITEKFIHLHRNIPDLIEARAKYDDYMNQLASKYPSQELFELMQKNNMIDEYIPPKPKLKSNKNTKVLAKIYKNGGVVSKVNTSALDVIEENIKALTPPLEYIECKYIDVVGDEEYRNVVGCKPLDDKYVERKATRPKKNNVLDMFDDYFTRSYVNKKSARSDDELYELTPEDIILESEKYKEFQYRDEMDRMGTVMFGGSLLSTTEGVNKFIMNAFQSAGFGVNNLRGKFDPKLEKEMLKDEKRKKKADKRAKKFNKKFDDEYFSSFTDIDNTDFETFSKAYQDLTASSVFNGGGLG
jgi:hypothetical protein